MTTYVNNLHSSPPTDSMVSLVGLTGSVLLFTFVVQSSPLGGSVGRVVPVTPS